MIAVTTFKGSKVALFGLGGSGLVTAQALMAGGAEVIAFDDSQASLAKAQAQGISTADLRGLDWSRVSALVLAPGVPLTHPKPHWSVDLARAANVEIVGDIELFARQRRAFAPDCPLIAVTGTNGKSTTTVLIAHILAGAGRDTQMGGNIGRAILSLDPPAAQRFYVIECSSYQIDLAQSLDPTVALLINLSPDHLNRHGTMQHYADVKERLVAKSGLAVIGIDDSHSARIADRVERAGVRLRRISRRDVVSEGFYAEGTRIVQAWGGTSAPFADLDGIATLIGAHNAQNAAATIAACLSVGVSEEEVQAGLKSFPGLKHRMQLVARRDGVVFVNDSKATNAEAAAPALSSYERIYWIAGGRAKEGGIVGLGSLFSRIAKAYLIGEAASQFAAMLSETVPYEMCGTLDRAVAQASTDAAQDSAPEKAVMLSPACASFDQYGNFKIRGDHFVALVAALDGVTMLVVPQQEGQGAW